MVVKVSTLLCVCVCVREGRCCLEVFTFMLKEDEKSLAQIQWESCHGKAGELWPFFTVLLPFPCPLGVRVWTWVCVSVSVRRIDWKRGMLAMCVMDRERNQVCVSKWERELERVCVCICVWGGGGCVSVCVRASVRTCVCDDALTGQVGRTLALGGAAEAHCASGAGSNEMCQWRQGPDGTSKWSLFLQTGPLSETRTGTQADSFAQKRGRKTEKVLDGKEKWMEVVNVSISTSRIHGPHFAVIWHTLSLKMEGDRPI